VLVRPRRGGNVGAVARAMKNMGLRDLVLVAPRARLGASARHMAVHAEDVLRGCRAVATLDEALADVALAVGTIGREIASTRRIETPRAFAATMRAAARTGCVALVFGPEDHGLSNAELDRCQALLRIPADPAYGSLNLAQAVLLCAYEIHLAAEIEPASPKRKATRRGKERDAEARPATGAEREALFEHLEEALARIGFLQKQNPAHIMRDVRALLGRAGLTQRDVRVWRGIARQVLWSASRSEARR